MIKVIYDYICVLKRKHDKNSKYENRYFKYIEKYNMETSMLYDALGIAENLILVENNTGLHELATGLPVTTDNTIYLEIQEKTGEQVVDIFVEHPDYENLAKNFFESYKKGESYVNSTIKSK